MQQAQFGQQLRRLHIGAWILILCMDLIRIWPLVAKSHRPAKGQTESLRKARIAVS
jgi:hypothetical protein